MKPTILTFVHYYLPGYKSGGPIRTIANLVEHLGDDFEFRIVTSDRDALDTAPYPDVNVDNWNHIGKAQVFYASAPNLSLKSITRLMARTPHDLCYLNSFFDPVFTFKPLLARRIEKAPKIPFVIAPRGELARNALTLKRWKKTPFKKISIGLGLYDNLFWQASSAHEKADILREIGGAAKNISIAPDLPNFSQRFAENNMRTRNDPLKILYLARISPIKNLTFALNVLNKVKTSVIFNIYGPIRDSSYWQQCQYLMEQLPDTVRIAYKGPVEHFEVPAVMADHDLFFLPTQGENYGHAIVEALSAGTPVLIADTTPWRGLWAKGVGWDLPLGEEQLFVEAIETAARLSPHEYSQWRKRVLRHGLEIVDCSDSVADNRRLFLDALALSGGSGA